MKTPWLFIASLAALAAPARGAIINTSYTGANGGNWNLSTNWTPTGVPNNGANTFNVTIDGGRPNRNVLLNQNATIDNLTITAGDSLTISNGQQLAVRGGGAGLGSVNNQGVITISSTGGHTYFRPAVGDLTLSGGGSVVMSDTTTCWIYHTGAGNLINQDNTIRGAGNIGSNTMGVTNGGSIIADGVNPLTIDPDGVGVVNTGTLAAENGALLNLAGGEYDNASGVIEAGDASAVRLDSGTAIHGGTLQTVGSGEFRTISSTLDGSVNTVNFSGRFNIENGQTLLARGTINNTGTIEVNSSGGNTYFRPTVSDLTLTGGGEVVLSDAVNNWLYHTGAGNLINQDNTIRGAGNIGSNTNGITNGGSIIADGVNPLTIDPDGVGVVNTGLLAAEDGAVLNLAGGEYDNVAGIIQAGDGSAVRLGLGGGAAIHGGTLQTLGSGEFRTISSTLDGSVNTVNFSGRFNIENGQSLLARGTLNNTGVIEVNSSGGNTYFRPTVSDLTLTGGGEIVLSDAVNNWLYHTGAGNLINLDNTIRGAGNIGSNTNGVSNAGTIRATGTVALTIDVDNVGLQNSGTLEVTGSGGMLIQAGPFTNTGNILIHPTRTLTRSTTFQQTAGTTTVNGTLSVTGGGAQMELNGGVLKGTGSVSGKVQNNGGSVQPGASVGSLSMTTFTQTGTGKLTIEIGGTGAGQYDQLVVTGVATVGGSLELVFVNGYVPVVGDTFTIVTRTSGSGAFVATNVGTHFCVAYNPSSVVVTVLEPCVADIVCDNAVNVSDLLAVISGWGACAIGCPPRCLSDVNNDCATNVTDLLAVIGNWGGCP